MFLYRKCLLFFYISWSVSLVNELWAQSPYQIEERVRFALGMFEQNKLQAYLTELEQIQFEIPDSVQDTLSFLAGKAAHQLGKFTQAEIAFSNIRTDKEYMYAYSHLYRNYRQWLRDSLLINPIAKSKDESINHPVFKEYAVLLSISRKLIASPLSKTTGSAQDPFVRSAYLQIEQAQNRLASQKKKSPWVAGLLSAVIPGAGKCYLKQWGAGAMSLITFTTFALQANEGYQYRKHNPFQWYLFAGLGSIYYFSTIYADILHAKAYNAQLFTDFKQSLVIQVTIPLERLFAD